MPSNRLVFLKSRSFAIFHVVCFQNVDENFLFLAELRNVKMASSAHESTSCCAAPEAISVKCFSVLVYLWLVGIARFVQRCR